jgi:LCP family protein required for cell wall assembly
VPNSYDAYPVPEDPARSGSDQQPPQPDSGDAAQTTRLPVDSSVSWRHRYSEPPARTVDSGAGSGTGSGGGTGGSGPTEPPAGPPKRHRRRKRRAGRVFRWIAVTVVALLLVTGGYVFFNYQRFVGGVTHVDAIPGAAADAEDFDGTDQNILLVGDDHRPEGATDAELAQLGTEDDGGGINTDSMMVLHIPADGSSATIISFPRDSWVDVPGFGKNKLNSAFSLGGGNEDPAAGARLLITTIQNLSGLTIDHYVRVSLLGFYTIADALGPIEVCLNNAVDDPYSTLVLPAGVSTLNAQQALSFVRQRHGLPNGDLDRQVRQQYFLSVEARRILSAGTLLNPFKLGTVLDAVSSSIETDSGLNFIDLAAQMKGLNADNIHTATIPILGTPTIYSGGYQVSIVEVDTEGMPAFIQGLIGAPSAYDTAAAAAPADVTVTVLNGARVTGAAASATATFANLGFLTGVAGSTDTTARTTIKYSAGQESAAKAVATYLPGALAVADATVTGVTVVLGTDLLPIVVPTPVDPSAPVAPEPTETAAGTTYAAGACIN